MVLQVSNLTDLMVGKLDRFFSAFLHVSALQTNFYSLHYKYITSILSAENRVRVAPFKTIDRRKKLDNKLL